MCLMSFNKQQPNSHEMMIILNGEQKKISSKLTVFELLEILLVSKNNIAVEVNQKVIQKKQFHDITIYDGDIVEIVSFVGGG